MRCPNCHSVSVDNYGLCPYCGYDIGEYVRNVQDRGAYSTAYANNPKVLTRPAFNYENGYFYYKYEYEKEKSKNDRYKKTLLYGGAAMVFLLHIAELLALAAIYMT